MAIVSIILELYAAQRTYNPTTVSPSSISRLETAAQYQSSVRGRCARLTETCDDAASHTALSIDRSVVEFWKREWEKQQTRAGEYNAAVEKFVELETEEEKEGKTRSVGWKEQFEAVVGKMEEWAARMREILSEEGVWKLVVEDEKAVDEEAAEGV